MSSNTNGDHKAKLEIVVVGGSLGGLCAGVALKSLGHNVTILERNPSPLLQNQGAGVVAGGDTLAFFKTYDRCQRPIAIAARKRIYLNKAGDVIHEIDGASSMTSWDLAYYLLRANFDEVESDYCTVPERRDTDGQSTYRYDSLVTDVKDAGKRVEVFFKSQDGREDSLQADLVVGSDGPSSTVRKILCPGVERKFTGYCALRGTIPEDEGSPAAKKAFEEMFAFFHDDGIQILAYLIPGKNGSVEPGSRLMNFVWYYNFNDKDFAELMTDAEGEKHRITLPPGKMRPQVWEKYKKVATDRLPPQFAELANKCRYPFAQAITDVISPSNSFLDGKVHLIGDALAGFRPHTVASTSQAAFDAMVLADMVSGKISHDDFVQQTMQFARLIQDRGVKMGNRSQFKKNVPLEEHINDRNQASTKREDELYPEWTKR